MGYVFFKCVFLTRLVSTASQRPTVSTPRFLKLFYKKCVFFTHMSKFFALSMKTACIQTIKAKQSLYYTYAQVISASKVGFFPHLKNRHSNCPQNSRLAFLVDFSGILQLKNTVLGLIGIQEMLISLFEKWARPLLT